MLPLHNGQDQNACANDGLHLSVRTADCPAGHSLIFTDKRHREIDEFLYEHDICGSDCADYKWCLLLVCDSVHIGIYVAVLRRNMLPPSSGWTIWNLCHKRSLQILNLALPPVGNSNVADTWVSELQISRTGHQPKYGNHGNDMLTTEMTKVVVKIITAVPGSKTLWNVRSSECRSTHIVNDSRVHYRMHYSFPFSMSLCFIIYPNNKPQKLG